MTTEKGDTETSFKYKVIGVECMERKIAFIHSFGVSFGYLFLPNTWCCDGVYLLWIQCICDVRLKQVVRTEFMQLCNE